MRRLTAAAGIAVALLALTACRSNPAVAAYVGDQTFTEDRVTQLLDEVKTAQPNADPQSLPTRETAVQALVIDAICQRVAKEKNVTLPAPQVQPGLPELATIGARVQSCNQALPADPVQPTDADLRSVYDNGVAVGAIDPKDPNQAFDKLKGQLAAGGQVARALGVRKALTEAASAADVSVNPRYRPITFPLLEFNQGPAISALLGQSSTAVTNS